MTGKVEAARERFGGSMLGRWSRMYSVKSIAKARAYDDSETYRLGAEWLVGPCATVEDWGCGRGWARQFFPSVSYVGVDGTASPHADVVADLREYRSQVDGIFMRHVLEHNVDWRLVLDNALASARLRMTLVFFTPFAGEETYLRGGGWVAVPDLAFTREQIAERIEAAGATFAYDDLDSPRTQYGVESLYRIETG